MSSWVVLRSCKSPDPPVRTPPSLCELLPLSCDPEEDEPPEPRSIDDPADEECEDPELLLEELLDEPLDDPLDDELLEDELLEDELLELPELDDPPPE